jgi:hypothetical protein
VGENPNLPTPNKFPLKMFATSSTPNPAEIRVPGERTGITKRREGKAVAKGTNNLFASFQHHE